MNLETGEKLQMNENDFMVFEEASTGKWLAVERTDDQYEFNSYLFDKNKEFAASRKLSLLFDKSVSAADDGLGKACDVAMELHGIDKTDVYVCELEDIEQELAVYKLHSALKDALKEVAVPLEKIDFTKENYNSLFPRSRIETPIENVKLGANQFEKLEAKERQNLLLAVHDTLKNPDLIINEQKENVFGEQEDSHLYARSFLIDDKAHGIQSVVVSIDGENVSISTHERSVNNIVNKIKKPDQLLYAAAKVRLLAERTTGNQLVTVNPIRENEYVVSPTTNIQQLSESVKFQSVLKDALKEVAVPLEKIEFTRNNYNKLFPYSKIETPIESVKMGTNQFEKLEAKERQNLLLAVHDTLKNPDLIINEQKENVFGEQEDSHLYAKSFLIDDKVHGIQSVVVSIDGENVSISTHERSVNNIVNKIKKPDQLLYAAAKVRLLVEQHTEIPQSVVNPIRENEYVVSPTTNIQQLSESVKLQSVLKDALKEVAVPLEKIEFTRDNYNKLFPEGHIKTPIESVKMGEHQFEKLEANQREFILQAAYDTLSKPDLIIAEQKENIFGEQEDSHLYAKSFLIDDKAHGIQSVVVSIDGENVSVSTHERDINNFVNKIKKPDQLLYAAAKVRLLVEQHTEIPQLMVNPTREFEYVKSLDSNIQQQAESVKSPQEIATDLVLEKLRQAKINVITEESAMQSVLDAGIEVQKMAAHYGTNQNIENSESFNGYGAYVLSVNEENAKTLGLRIASKKYGNSFYINNQPLQEFLKEQNFSPYWQNVISQIQNPSNDKLLNRILTSDLKGNPALIKEQSQLSTLCSQNLINYRREQTYLYSVEIPDNNGTNYLFYDKTIGLENANRINEELEKIGTEWKVSRNDTGNSVYFNILSGKVFNSQKQASEFLQKIGYVGMETSSSNYIIFDDREMNINNRVQYMMSEDGEVYGFAYNGEIYADKNLMSSNVLAHEYTHLWDNYTKNANPELWERGKNVFKQTTIWNEVLNDPSYRNIKNNEDEILSECHARICGEFARQVLERIAAENGENVKNAVIDWDSEVNSFIAKEFGFTPELGSENYVSDSIKAESLKEFLANSMKDLMAGRGFEKKIEKGNGLSRQIKTADQIIFADSEISRVTSLILQNGGSHVQLKGINTQALNSNYNKDKLLSTNEIKSLNNRENQSPQFMNSNENISQSAEKNHKEISFDKNWELLIDESLIKAEIFSSREISNICEKKYGFYFEYENHKDAADVYNADGNLVGTSYGADGFGFVKDFKTGTYLIPADNEKQITELAGKYLQAARKEIEIIEDAKRRDTINEILAKSKSVWDSQNKDWQNISRSFNRAIINEDYKEAKNVFDSMKNDKPFNDYVDLHKQALYLHDGKSSKLEQFENYLAIHSEEFISKFGDWEKANRIEKLKNASNLEFSKEIRLEDENLTEQVKSLIENEDRKGILSLEREIGKTVVGNYINNDLNENIIVTNNNIREISHHHAMYYEHIVSIGKIPEIIKNGIYISDVENKDRTKHPNIEKYQYFATGIKIGEEYYTCKSVVGIDKNNNCYYDQSLSSIEKGKLIDIIQQKNKPGNLSHLIATWESEPLENKSPSAYYDKRLINICQVPQMPYLEMVNGKWQPKQEAVQAVKEGKLYVEKDENGIQILHDENKGITIGKELSETFKNQEKHYQSVPEWKKTLDNLMEMAKNEENEQSQNHGNETELSQWYETVDWEDPIESAEAWQNGTQEQIDYIRKRQNENHEQSARIIDNGIESLQENSGMSDAAIKADIENRENSKISEDFYNSTQESSDEIDILFDDINGNPHYPQEIISVLENFQKIESSKWNLKAEEKTAVFHLIQITEIGKNDFEDSLAKLKDYMNSEEFKKEESSYAKILTPIFLTNLGQDFDEKTHTFSSEKFSYKFSTDDLKKDVAEKGEIKSILGNDFTGGNVKLTQDFQNEFIEKGIIKPEEKFILINEVEAVAYGTKVKQGEPFVTLTIPVDNDGRTEFVQTKYYHVSSLEEPQKTEKLTEEKSKETEKTDKNIVIYGKTKVPEFAMITQHGLENFKDMIVESYEESTKTYLLKSEDNNQNVRISENTLNVLASKDYAQKAKNYTQDTKTAEKMVETQYEDFFKLRSSCANNFRHNLAVFCREEANSPLDALKLANSLISQMPKDEKRKTKELLNLLKKDGQSVNEVIIETYHEAVKEVPLNEDYLNNRRYEKMIARPMYDTISAKGEKINRDFNLKIGDSVQMSFKVNKNPSSKFSLRKENLSQNCTIISASKEGNLVTVMDGNKSFYDVPRDTFLKEYAKKQKVENKMEKKTQRKMSMQIDIGR